MAVLGPARSCVVVVVSGPYTYATASGSSSTASSLPNHASVGFSKNRPNMLPRLVVLCVECLVPLLVVFVARPRSAPFPARMRADVPRVRQLRRVGLVRASPLSLPFPPPAHAEEREKGHRRERGVHEHEYSSLAVRGGRRSPGTAVAGRQRRRGGSRRRQRPRRRSFARRDVGPGVEGLLARALVHPAAVAQRRTSSSTSAQL